MTEDLQHSPPPWYILPVIVLAQFFGTSLWFASNAIVDDLTTSFRLGAGAASDLTSAVQFGFISGTLVLAFLSVADRFSPVRVYLASATLGALFNQLMVWLPAGPEALVTYRFLTGFCLAGIYPVGMKIAADWFPKKLGQALGVLVGALTLGKALPYLIRTIGADWNWTVVVSTVSVLAMVGGILLFALVGDGPFRHPRARFKLSALFEVFRERDFRAAAFGYFGHMWELYAFWVFVPIILAHYGELHPGSVESVPFWAFLVLGIGFFGCALGGWVSLDWGSARVAFTQLGLSLICCLCSVWMYEFPPVIFFSFLLLWGAVVVGDSPQFSTLNARTAPPEWLGSALTIATCIGFAITIGSIQLLKYIHLNGGLEMALLALAPGPILGLLAIRSLVRRKM